MYLIGIGVVANAADAGATGAEATGADAAGAEIVGVVAQDRLAQEGAVVGKALIEAGREAGGAEDKDIPAAVASQNEDTPVLAAESELTPEMNLSLAQLLASSDEELQPEGERCLRAATQYRVSILDEGHLLFRGRGKRAWLNRLRGSCTGMRPEMILVTERRGSSRQCELDTVFATTRSQFGRSGLDSARCFLGKFEPVTPEHAAVLEVAFEQQRRDLRNQRRIERRQRKAAKRAGKDKPPITDQTPEATLEEPIGG